MGRKLELAGKTFGHLTVLEEYPERKKGLVQWKCQCDCGNTSIVPGSWLVKGNTQSCGCQNAIKKYNLEQSQKTLIPVGTKFGKLTVIEDLGFRPHVEGHSRRWYLCQCECGNTKEVMGNSLKTEHTCSCGKCNYVSQGEYHISQLLQENNINFLHDTIFPEFLCETGRKLRFDFIICNPDNTFKFIEVDGRQHYTGPDTEYWGHTSDTLETIKERDTLKNDFCVRHGYPLYRIPYWKIKNITFDNLFDNSFLVKEGL